MTGGQFFDCGYGLIIVHSFVTIQFTMHVSIKTELLYYLRIKDDAL